VLLTDKSSKYWYPRNRVILIGCSSASESRRILKLPVISRSAESSYFLRHYYFLGQFDRAS